MKDSSSKVVFKRINGIRSKAGKVSQDFLTFSFPQYDYRRKIARDELQFSTEFIYIAKK